MDNEKQYSIYGDEIFAKWILKESLYAEYEEDVDGESHDRYVCSDCGFEAGFHCDPDGFADYQVLSKYCGNCSARMENGH